MLSCKNFYARLGLTTEFTPKPLVRQCYYKLALLVHPDKCADVRATEAFKLISEAFDTLYDVEAQEAYLIRLSQPPPKRTKRSGTQTKSNAAKPRPSWWQKRSMEEILRDLKQREAEEQALRDQFTANMKSRFALKRTTRDLQAASRICEELDKEQAIIDSELWPLTEEMRAQSENSLSLLVNYLRSKHVYCIYCGVRFVDSQDLEDSCPGSSYEDHS